MPHAARQPRSWLIFDVRQKMHPNAQEIFEAIWGYAAVFAVAVASLSGWIGGIVAGRIARKETARIEREAREHEDALVRRRNVYSRLATGMRVFHQSDVPSSSDEKKAAAAPLAKAKIDFLTAYDESCVWASEPVIEKIGSFLDTMMRLSGDLSADGMKEKQDAYVACIEEMRRDSGFPESRFRFRFVKF